MDAQLTPATSGARVTRRRLLPAGDAARRGSMSAGLGNTAAIGKAVIRGMLSHSSSTGSPLPSIAMHTPAIRPCFMIPRRNSTSLPDVTVPT